MSKYNGPLFINSHGVRRSSIQAANLVVVMVAICLEANSSTDQVPLFPGLGFARLESANSGTQRGLSLGESLPLPWLRAV